MFEAIDGYEDVRRALKDADAKLPKLIEGAMKAVADGSLHADGLINALLSNGRSVGLTDTVLEAAKLRVLLGNPPGKAGSYGDAVNWETLLAEVPDREDLVLVTSDRDFKSRLDPNRLNEYLIDEWGRKKGSHVHLHGTLRSALEAHYPEIQLAPEPDPERDQAVERLIGSGSFAETHLAIARLSRFSEFTAEQLASLVVAANDNSQVRGIIQDDDVFEFYDGLSRQYGALMRTDVRDDLNGMLKAAETYRATFS